MPRLRLARIPVRILLAGLAAAACLSACIADPEPARTSDAPAAPGASAPTAMHLRVALPAGDTCAVESAFVSVRAGGLPDRRIAMEVSDTALDADIGDLSPGATAFAVSAYGRGGALAFYGESTFDPAQAGASVTVALGRVGRIRLEAGFPDAALD